MEVRASATAFEYRVFGTSLPADDLRPRLDIAPPATRTPQVLMRIPTPGGAVPSSRTDSYAAAAAILIQ